TDYLPKFLANADVDTLIEEMEGAAGSRAGDIGSDAIRIENSVELRVLSPSAGIFFATPSPAEPEYVQPGQRIGLNDILCQLEAFKIFTPLRLEDYNSGDNGLYRDSEYEVTHVNVTSGQQVNAGDLLFVVKPMHAAEAG
ncbi:MAG: acetyl-CoA carboxylase biotin carboxyl carrier protein subunit, partial [Gammaproteobacteria bacterium]|nr:acetyl-CoA carboxylase biotin carboxyl carrier protein subunit [Gammaproteobacteria bacterium]